MKNIASLIATSVLCFAFIGCGTTNEEPIVKEINDIKISPLSATIYSTTNELNLTASANYNDSSNADITQAARWETDFNIATLSYGKLTPKANGEDNSSTTIDVTLSYKDLQDTASVTIIALTALHIDDSNLSDPIVADVNYTLKAYADYDNNQSNISIDANNSNEIHWSIQGSATLVDESNGSAIIRFSSGDANVTVSAFGINDTKSYHIK
ncbi:hypothetical protein MNB_SM-7-1472 [hydrothermal vent metagenome]|uniref:BIG2 domain-containing protein n=1 Tax=hydrothermal vent metagenome TaxID=652676 RepID=A0A1W1B8L4_9ZZZZ